MLGAQSQALSEFAVNLDPTESRTAQLPADELERLGAPLTRQKPVLVSSPAAQLRLRNADLEARQKLWRWVIVATVGMLLLETWLAGRTTRGVVPEGRAT